MTEDDRGLGDLLRAYVQDEKKRHPLRAADLYANIERTMQGEPASMQDAKAGAKLKLIQGGQNIREPRRKRWLPKVAILSGALAAAAALWFVWQPQESQTEVASTRQAAATPEPAKAPTLVAAAEVLQASPASAIVEADFGEGSGTVFSVESSEGEMVAVAWINE